MGTSDADISLTIDTREGALGCEVYISRNKDLFSFLRERQPEIEKEVGEKIEWIDAAVASRVKIKAAVGSVLAPVEMPSHFAWLYQKAILFHNVFGKYLKEFRKHRGQESVPVS